MLLSLTGHRCPNAWQALTGRDSNQINPRPAPLKGDVLGITTLRELTPQLFLGMWRGWLPVVVALCVGRAVAFDLIREYAGSTFFNGWDFYGYWDNLTLGMP